MLIIDRFEEMYAVVEDDENDGRMINISKELLDTDCAEGDVIVQRDGRYYPDKEKTAQRREEILQKLKKLGF